MLGGQRELPEVVQVDGAVTVRGVRPGDQAPGAAAGDMPRIEERGRNQCRVRSVMVPDPTTRRQDAATDPVAANRTSAPAQFAAVSSSSMTVFFPASTPSTPISTAMTVSTAMIPSQLPTLS